MECCIYFPAVEHSARPRFIANLGDDVRLDLHGRPIGEERCQPCALRRIGIGDDETGFKDRRHTPLLSLACPIKQTVLNTWVGTGPYQGSNESVDKDHKFYEEVGYLVTNLDRSSETIDRQGSLRSDQIVMNVAGIQRDCQRRRGFGAP